jgi:hypothetical protein
LARWRASTRSAVRAEQVHHIRGDADGGEGVLDFRISAAGFRLCEARVDDVEHLHEGARDRHDEEVAIDDVAQLMGDDGAGLFFVQEFEDAVGQHDARAGPEDAVGESRGIAVGDDADRGRREAVFAGDVVDDAVDVRIAHLEV